MDRVIKKCIENNYDKSHILPFFWQHGEEHSELIEELDAIKGSGINEFCVESRVHHQFCEEKWWQDFGFLLKEAKERDMHVWLLDDKFFPTGYANNYIQDHPELRLTSIRVAYYDFSGPQSDIALIPEPLDSEEKYLSIVAYKRESKDRETVGKGINLIPFLQDDLLFWDIPEGVWRIYYVIRTHRVCDQCKLNYIDMMSKESCKAMIKAVYEPHYEHFSEYFGNTFKGFFSDEPGFSNDIWNYNSILGKEDMLIPWSDDIPQILSEYVNISVDDIMLLLPALWHCVDGKETIREAYMQAATMKFRDNFSFLLGNWCREHKVMYIGHIIEDMGTHQRLGHGAGHFFRGLDGQDMAGMDIVLHQIVPGHYSLKHTGSVIDKLVHTELFQYALPKMASSHSHIQPLKKNRAVCELFGAFGWAEGVPTMKFIADNLLVCGINHFVPHAFSSIYPDKDCPPHFYANGKNAQYELFGKLVEYMHRMANILSDGTHKADVAVYYNAEAEWSGGRLMQCEKPCAELTRNQIDYDIIPQDSILSANIKADKLCINNETYSAVVVPYSQYLPDSVIDAFERFSNAGVSVVFCDALPDMSSQLKPVDKRLKKCKAISFGELCNYLKKEGKYHISAEQNTTVLRFYHIKREETDVIMLWNEDIYSEIDTYLDLPIQNPVFYDAWENKIYKPQIREKAVRIKLAPAETIVVFSGNGSNIADFDYRDGKLSEIIADWKISVRDVNDIDFSPVSYNKLGSLAKYMPHFSGVIKYETELTFENTKEITALDLGKVGETAQLWINGEYLGAKVAQPFSFRVENAIKEGINTIKIEVAVSPAYRERDELSRFLPLSPMGVLGPIGIRKK